MAATDPPAVSPARNAFRIEIDEDAGVVRLIGELDLVVADDAKAALLGLDRPEVVADLSQLEFVDSTGLSALCTARRQVSESGRRIALSGACGAARRAFEAAGLEDVLDDE